jgi:predicted nucleotidyltransferase
MTDLGTIAAVVQEVARRNGATLAIVFGSFARGTATEHSDVDVLFVEPTDLPFLRRLDRYFDPLVDRLRMGVDVLVYSPEEFMRLRDRPFVARILREGRVVYESGAVQHGREAVVPASPV